MLAEAMLENRVLKEVPKHLRHKTPSITLAIYGHLYDDDLPAMAVAMDELLLASK